MIRDNAIFIGIDPGVSTGVTVLRVPNAHHFTHGPLGERSFELVASTVVHYTYRFSLYNLIEKYRDHIEGIQTEDFHVYPGKAKALIGSALEPCRIIGIVELACTLLDVFNKLTLLPASTMLNVAIEHDMMQLIPNTEHNRDSYRHAKYALTVCRYALHMKLKKAKATNGN